MLAGTIGSRPVGTPANARARAYIIDQLRLFGFEVRVQDADARRVSIGRTARVSNIIAIKPGRRSQAIGVISHYDSVPAGPGAGDDGFGVAVSLEAARVLGARTDRNWTLMVIVTDGEEAGLMGAAAVVTDREVSSRLQAYINLESIGSGGVPALFETGPGNGWLIGPWARHVPSPRGASFGVEIYRRLPNDTDFSILKRQGIPGLNFAVVDDSYAYHTTRDTPERLSPVTLRESGDQIVALVTALDGVDITQRSPTERTFFDVASASAISYGPLVGWVIAGLAFIFGVVAWVRVLGTALRLEGVWRWLLTVIWTLAGSTAIVAAMIGTTWALRHAREVYHPWYARPDRLFLLMLAVGGTVGWGFVRLGHWLPARAHGIRHPLVVWSIALPVWIALAAVALTVAPGAAFLWLVPLLIAGVLLTIVPPSSVGGVRAVSGLILVAVAAIWLLPTITMLRFVVAIFGRLPVVTPVFVYAAIITVAAIVMLPPLIALIARTRPLVRPALGTALGLLAVAIMAGLAYVAPACTDEQPLRRAARAVQEADGPAVWDVGSVEPGIDLGEGAPSGWQPAGAGPTASAPFRRLQQPFVFQATGPTLGKAPISVAALTLEPVQAGSELSLTVIPHNPGLVISFVLPEGIEPARSNLPGVLRLGRWTATYIAPTADGLLFRASVGRIDPDRLRDLRVVVTALGPGDRSGWQPPPWLPQARTAWTTEANWIVAPFAMPIAPVPALR